MKRSSARAAPESTQAPAAEAPRLRLDEFTPYRLSFTSNLVSETIAGAYQRLFGLSIPEWRLVSVVAEQPGITQQEIGRRTRMDKVTVSRAAAALGRRGLVDRAARPEDGRSHRLSLSPVGWRLYAEVAPKALELEAGLFDGFTPGELKQFTALLRRIDAAALRALGAEEGAARPGG